MKAARMSKLKRWVGRIYICLSIQLFFNFYPAIIFIHVIIICIYKGILTIPIALPPVSSPLKINIVNFHIYSNAFPQNYMQYIPIESIDNKHMFDHCFFMFFQLFVIFTPEPLIIWYTGHEFSTFLCIASNCYWLPFVSISASIVTSFSLLAFPPFIQLAKS